MSTEVRLAVAGSGKTAEIVNKISAQTHGTTSLALTFTQQAQAEIILRTPGQLASEHETMGWFSFLVRHIVRPYLPEVFSDIIPRGLCFVESAGGIPRNRGGWKYYLNDEHQPYSIRLALLAKKVITATNGAPIKRLEKIYDKIYIDEFQDLVGNDLEILKAMMESDIDMLIVGDVRQSVLSTSQSDRLNQSYRGVKLVEWFRNQSDAGLCRIVPSDVTTRFNQDIANFSDLIHDPALNLPCTISRQVEVTGHDGVFLVDDLHLLAYAANWPESPTVLWSRKSNRLLPDGEVQTFGKSKGITRDRVIIVATGPVVDLLKSHKPLAAKSACGFYVAATRARHSVAIVTKNAAKVYSLLHPDFQGKISLWEPEA
ncbi:MAG: UvrD-helicase domain-containing protein [Gordonia sp. (in: high G+C Gram-positive bacteria)]|uniref:UvrD-helicase domain-containing protein n=1 Tax=Gordonia sp. (in: high G+C Gram-positive bacteria) TaxID=84139 RepID=UPI0039E235C5